MTTKKATNAAGPTTTAKASRGDEMGGTMRNQKTLQLSLWILLAGCGGGGDPAENAGPARDALFATENLYGIAESAHSAGSIDLANPFFSTSISANGRTCGSCHGPDMGWGLTAEKAKQLFEDSQGLDPLFNLVDAGSRPDADVSTVNARRATFATVIKKGLIRAVRNAPPATAEFEVIAVVDPAGWGTTAQWPSFRRPNPTGNERLASSVSWSSPPPAMGGVPAHLAGFMQAGASSHAQFPGVVSTADREAGRDLMLSVTFAQAIHEKAGALDADGAKGGPAGLLTQPFALGANDPLGPSFDPKIFDLYDAWTDADADDNSPEAKARAAIARGQTIFNTRSFNISGVSGLNDVAGQPVIAGTCGTCHSAPNIGVHPVVRLMDTGTADASRRAPELPLVTVRDKATSDVRSLSDLGRGLATGKWVDLGKFKVPPLRGLAARAPYFHDGQAATIEGVIKYYEQRFGFKLAGRERHDLEAFLAAL